MPPLEELIEHILNGEVMEEPYKKRMYCPHCDKTWIEIVGHIIRKMPKGESIHIRMGSNSPLHCTDCGCEYIFEISPPVEIEDSKDLCFNDIKIVKRDDFNLK